ncbi:hypothetical protein ACFCV3_00010 [Kribbella sp. NPDC056345]|uniref:hypothetical protein n=1 Tax=Kribbella sp. NPDC056345 TaxID=3345789 RepID=UPI0035DC3FC9
MKKRIMGAAVGLAAVLVGSLTAIPAHADGFDSARVYYKGDSGSGGYVSATLDFRSKTDVVVKNFTVRDVCPGDGHPVRAQVYWRYPDGGYGDMGKTWKADDNGCGSNGTNFGDFRISRSKGMPRVFVMVCTYTKDHGNLRCASGAGRANDYYR